MRRLAAFSALLGASAVALGAFGAHALNDQLSDESRVLWMTATAYLLPHAAAAFAAGQVSERPLTLRGGWLLALGAAWFAATLYAMALGAPRWLGAVTPVGGLGMIAGWLVLGAAALGRDKGLL